ncbi:hypothetical protein B6S12_05455 [Helicobacter valdiviensis]|uniref:Motility accessory factor n=1 Tax=Helicobacter valdiviensis TaxID=1458358 RepID=A0A2W6MUM7_9HELI|nr:6-hydroxymethylpterin diphosphokinase MptE-like protein [Helicobacter valdiviensis]PZT48167.1 hypothetical protein B6S12_05455 [Helicobacter valdiviensis]
MGILEFLKSADCEEIEKFCQRRFQENLYFFQNDYPNLFEALKSEAKEYQLYIGKEGVNILNFKNNSFLYSLDEAGKSSMLLVHENCSFNPLLNQQWKRIFGSRACFMGEEFPFTSRWVNEILAYTMNNGWVESFHLSNDFLPSLNLFGLGGGIFLQVLNENYESFHSFLIFEESLDLFRISCFFVDYPTLFSKTQDRAGYIFLESLVKKDYVYHYFLSRKISTSVMRLELSLYQSPLNISARELVHELHSQNYRGWGSFEDEMRGIVNKLSVEITKMLIEPKRINAPICVVANGPSLDFLLPFIKENQEKMIIFSCGTALKPLKKAGIIPDFQVEIERHDYLEGVLKEAPLGDVPLLCASVLDKKAKELAKEFYCFERAGSSAANFKAPKFQIQFSAPLVGNAGAALASYLGSDVILCGLDCGYKEGSTKHAKNSYYGEEEKNNLPSDAFRVRGNFSDDIYSDALYSLSRTSLEEAFSALKPFNILNLNDGAFIKGARPTHYDEFDLKEIDKKQQIENLKSLFKDPKTSDFYSKNPQSHVFEVLAFKNRIGDLFKEEVKNKKELFIRVDKISDEIAKTSKTNPLVTILFSGSLSHFLYHIVLSCLHLPHNNIEHIWIKAQELYNSGFEAMVEYFNQVVNDIKVEH